MKNIKANIKNFLFRKGYIVKKIHNSNIQKARECIAIIRSMLVSVDMIRIGAHNDGGYLVPNNLQGIRYCFSPGVAFTSDFELQLAKDYAITSFMIDASVEKPLIESEYFSFDKKFLGCVTKGVTITLRDWIHSKEKIIAHDNNMILQMDIESAEFAVLLETPIEVLTRFCIMVIEFHSMQCIFDTQASAMLHSSIFDKLQKQFYIAHMHPNNNGAMYSYDGIAVPELIEITFVRTDWAISNNTTMRIPHPLDKKNKRTKADIIMPTIWWDK